MNVSNEEIRSMARERFEAIPRVIVRDGAALNHPDGTLLDREYALQVASEVVDDVILACAASWSALPAQAQPVALDYYDAGLLSDAGGGDVTWWQDYIRAELGRAHEFYQSQADALATPVHAQAQGEAAANGFDPSTAPLPPTGSALRALGEYLSTLLDEDRWATAEQYLFAAVAEANAIADGVIVPPKYTLVPEQPTFEMLYEFQRIATASEVPGRLYHAYAAMLAAAPPSPAKGDTTEGVRLATITPMDPVEVTRAQANAYFASMKLLGLEPHEYLPDVIRHLQSIYDSAVAGRAEFRDALREVRAALASRDARLSALSAEVDKARNIAARFGGCLWGNYGVCPECGNPKENHMPGCEKRYEANFSKPADYRRAFDAAFPAAPSRKEDGHA